MVKEPKYLIVKKDCEKCEQYLKRYCVGTYENEKGLKCGKCVTNGMKYRSVIRSKRNA